MKMPDCRGLHAMIFVLLIACATASKSDELTEFLDIDLRDDSDPCDGGLCFKVSGEATEATDGACSAVQCPDGYTALRCKSDGNGNNGQGAYFGNGDSCVAVSNGDNAVEPVVFCRVFNTSTTPSSVSTESIMSDDSDASGEATATCSDGMYGIYCTCFSEDSACKKDNYEDDAFNGVEGGSCTVSSDTDDSGTPTGTVKASIRCASEKVTDIIFEDYNNDADDYDLTYTPQLVTLHRYYSSTLVNHFYTTDSNEVGTTTVGDSGTAEGFTSYEYEGEVGSCYTEQWDDDLVPIMRYYNSGIEDHFLHSSAPSATSWKYQTILCYAWGGSSEPDASNFVTMHRYYASAQDHFYTTDSSEVDDSGNLDNDETVTYSAESYKFYLPSSCEQSSAVATPSTATIYRYYDSSSELHFYTTDPNEVGTTTVDAYGTATGFTSFQYVGEVGTCYTDQNSASDLEPLMRYYNTGTYEDFHLHSSSPDGDNYMYQKLLCYAWTSAPTDVDYVTMYRYYSSAYTHFFTTDSTEVDSSGYLNGEEDYTYTEESSNTWYLPDI